MTYSLANHQTISPRKQVSDLLRQIRSMTSRLRAVAAPKLIDEINSATDSIEVLMPLCDSATSEADMWPTVHLTLNHARLLGALRARMGQTVTKNALMDALYFDRPDDAPESKIIDVFICKIRKKIAHTGYAIKTVWGQGYKLVKPEESFENRDALQALKAA